MSSVPYAHVLKPIWDLQSDLASASLASCYFKICRALRVPSSMTMLECNDNQNWPTQFRLNKGFLIPQVNYHFPFKAFKVAGFGGSIPIFKDSTTSPIRFCTRSRRTFGKICGLEANAVLLRRRHIPTTPTAPPSPDMHTRSRRKLLAQGALQP